ncbi:MAG: GntR family transcriptional regulator, partial [Clostridia bacterium]|nr:GntR family transcriptional regulator [Clostridia bacterium]MDY5555385.1 GntR family transcriptional regulator [Blautia sp.]
KDILDGRYDTSSVIREKDIIDEYKVSRTPVREALVQLCTESFLENIPRYGYKLVVISPKQILEIIEFRKTIEIGALKLSFENITEKDIQELKELERKVSEIEKIHDKRIHWRCNVDFHEKLCSFCKNGYFIKALEDALRVCIGISNQYYTNVWNRNVEATADSHTKIIDALERKNLDDACMLLKKDIELFKSEIL